MQTRGSTNLLGIDFSSYQTISDQAKLLSTSPNYVYLRAYGSSHSAPDSTFITRAQLMRQNNIKSGGYYFATPTTPITSDGGAECDAQCDQFISILQQAYGTGDYGDCIPMLDVEAWGSTTPQGPMYYGVTGDQLIDWVKRFRDRFFNTTNRRLGIYTGRYFMTDPSQMNVSSTKLSEINDMPLWYADYEKYNTTSSNAYPTSAQMQANAQYILNYLTDSPHNWTKEAVCGMLGNMQTESQINPGVWQNLDSSNTSGGFGLVQWTPSTVLTNWANSNGLTPTAIDTQLRRILYELENGLQFYSTTAYPMTFAEFTKSTDDPATLAMAWLNNYERPANLNQPDRGTQATNWYNTLDFTEASSPPNLGGWTSFVLWQYSENGRSSDYGLSQAQNEVDQNRTDSIDRLLPPPPATNITATQTGDNTLEVSFTRPNIIDYLGASLYINGTWKKWLAKTATSDIFTYDITNEARNVAMNYRIVVEDTYSDFGYSDVQSITLYAPTPVVVTPAPAPTPPPDPSNPAPDTTNPDTGVIAMPTVSMGTTLKKGTTVIALLTSIDGLNLKSDSVESTALDTVGGYKTYVSTLKDAGEVSISGHFDYAAHSEFLTDFEGLTIQSYTIEFPDKGATGIGTTWTFSGIVTDYHTSADLGNLIKFESTIKVSGAPTLAGPA